MRIANDSYRPPEWVCLKTFHKSLRCTFMLIHATHPLRCTNCEVCFAQHLQFTAMTNHLVLANIFFFPASFVWLGIIWNVTLYEYYKFYNTTSTISYNILLLQRQLVEICSYIESKIFPSISFPKPSWLVSYFQRLLGCLLWYKKMDWGIFQLANQLDQLVWTDQIAPASNVSWLSENDS